MVINSNLTVHLENIHVVIPSNRTRAQSVPNILSKSLKGSPDRSSNKERKRRLHRAKYVPDKPPFINFASAYINPYRNLTPIITNHSRHHRSKSKKRSKRKSKKSDNTADVSREQQEKPIEEESFSRKILHTTTPIDLWPSNPKSFDMDFTRRRQIAIDNTSYRESIHAWRPSSLNELISLIKLFAEEKNAIEQIWSIFYWISQNISYDIGADFDHNRNVNQRPDEIVQIKKTTYEGYATLFKTLCENIGIKCIDIPGYVKDSHFKLNQNTFSQINHIWNAVQINGDHWYLIDTVFGSGYMDNKYKFRKHLNIHYFLTRPEQMIYDHLPNDNQWQCLAKPISMFDYFRLPYLTSYYFIYNLTLVSPRFSSIVRFDKNESYAEVLVQAPNDIQLTCSILNDQKNTCLTQYDANNKVWQCLFAPQKPGFYTLIVYANRLWVSNSLVNAIELGVEVTPKEFNRKRILPTTYVKFVENQCQIFSPLDGVLKCGTKIILHCRIPNACYVRISLDGICLEEMRIKNDVFKQQITVPQREIIVYAQFNDKKLSNIYYGLVRYLVEK